MNNINTIITRTYRTSPSEYVRHALGGVLSNHMLTIGVPLTACSIALLAASIAQSDMRYAIILLMLWLIIVPMVLFIVYMSSALTPQAAALTLPRHAVISSHSGITIVYEPASIYHKNLRPPLHMPWSDIRSLTTDNTHLIATTSCGDVTIPLASIPSCYNTNLRQLLKNLSENG